jgi:hypothetical protein
VSGRGKGRSGVFERGDDPRPSDEERRALIAALGGEKVNRSHNRIAVAELEAEALEIVEDIYQRHGLPTGPEARWKAFLTKDQGKTWKPYERQTIDHGDEIHLWSALGRAAHGRPSEAGFASAIATKLDLLHLVSNGRPVEHDEAWLSAFLSGFRLAVSIAKWRWEFENKSMVDPRGPGNRSAGGQARGEAITLNARRHAAIWQADADEIWKRRPDLSKLDVARRIAAEHGGSVHTIRQVIRKIADE